MNIQTLFLAITAALTLATVAGCDDSGTTNSGGSAGSGNTAGSGGSTGGTAGSGGSGGSTSSIPAPPTLGAQIDRMGRPAINTAANQTFNSNPEQADQGKDGYNAAGSSKWGDYVPEIQKNLAILDAIDTVCGNQLLADAMKDDPSRYATLATVLADDRLYVNAEGANCSTYLGVEANAVGVMNDDCGGRTLAYDVIDVSYTILATGALDASVGDDVPISEAAKGEVFPYLADPY